MNVFWYVKVYIFWKFIQYTTQWDKTQMLKKFPSNKTTVTKKCTLFPLVDSNYHSFTFNSKSLYKLKHMVHLFKTVCGILDFPFHLVFTKHYIFCSSNSMDSLTSRTLIFKLQQVWKFNVWIGAPPKLTGYKLFKPLKSKFGVHHLFSVINIWHSFTW